VSSVDVGTDPVGRRGTWWSALVQWRNWPLLVKLGVVLVVPVVSALVLGVLRVHADVELADSYRGTERVAALRTQFVSVLSALQHERSESVRAGGKVDQAARATDRAVSAMTKVVRQNPELGDASTGYAAVERALEQLPAARRQLTTGADGMVVLSAYTAITDTVLEFDRSLVGRFPDENLAGTSIALGELLGMREQVAFEQAVGDLALRDRALAEGGRQMLLEADVRLDDKADNLRSQAPQDLVTRYDELVQAENVTEFQQMVDALRTTDPAGLPFTREQWEAASGATSDSMADLTRTAAANLSADSDALAESISDRAGLESVLLLTMVLLAAGVGGGLGRYLLRSVGQLRRTALDVAGNRLPAAVESIRAGKGAEVSVEPVPLQTTEEFGQLARAFDAVHGQAVRSAAEEASLRSNLANIFTNLSRRSQGLVERQLRLMEQLEQKTEDPEQLDNLFKIDHLATRMRRNNENLMVLSGTGLLRRFTEPMALPDVLRAAISEVEHYQRAVVRAVPEARIAGYAAGDLIRSVSELIENATAFSPPEAEVPVVSRLLQDGSAVIDILDHGVGLGERELREANQRITGGGGVDVPISRQMGLFVVGRLTSRHGIHVRLIPRAEGGVCASVLVPAGLVNISDPGATAALDLPPADQPGPATAKEWLRTEEAPAGLVPAMSAGSMGSVGSAASAGSAGAPAAWHQPSRSGELPKRRRKDAGDAPGIPGTPDAPGTQRRPEPAAAKESSWLTTATRTEPQTRGSTAISWLKAAKQAETAPEHDGMGTPPGGLPSLGGTSLPAALDTPPNGMPTLAGPNRPPAMGTPPNGSPAYTGTNPPPTPPLGMHAFDETNRPPRMGTPPNGIPSLGETSLPGPVAATPAAEPAAPAEGPDAPAEGSATLADEPAARAESVTAPAGGPATPAEGSAALAEEPTAHAEGTAALAERSAARAMNPAARAEGAALDATDAPSSAAAEEPSPAEVPRPAKPGSPSGEPPTVAGIPAVTVKPGAPSLPGEEFEPIAVAGKLRLAGITVNLQQFPDAATPASILFADDNDFGWLSNQQSPHTTPPNTTPPQPVPPQAKLEDEPAEPVVTVGPAGLPKRVPKRNLQGPQHRQPPQPERNASLARGFISNFQAGVRQGEDREGETGS
jgi:signal transduction histidine kinase